MTFRFDEGSPCGRAALLAFEIECKTTGVTNVIIALRSVTLLIRPCHASLGPALHASSAGIPCASFRTPEAKESGK